MAAVCRHWIFPDRLVHLTRFAFGSSLQITLTQPCLSVVGGALRSVGRIPMALARLTSLQELYLSGNELDGECRRMNRVSSMAHLPDGVLGALQFGPDFDAQPLQMTGGVKSPLILCA